MRLAFIALLAFLLALGSFLPLWNIQPAPELEFYRLIALAVLTGWLLIEAVIRRTSGKSTVAEPPPVEMPPAAEDPRIRQLSDELQTMRTAFNDGLAQMARMEEEKRNTASGASDADVVNFLGLLQNKGRFIDFLMDDVTKYPDQQVGAAARIVHQGCASVVREYFDIKPVLAEREGSELTLPTDFDARSYRLLGRVGAEPPYRGTLLHRGWLTGFVKLPRATEVGGSNAANGIIAPAEVEVR